MINRGGGNQVIAYRQQVFCCYLEANEGRQNFSCETSVGSRACMQDSHKQDSKCVG